MKDTRGLPPSEAELSEPSKAPRSLCIVVADDDRDTVLTLTMVLRHEGHDVLAAFNGQQVLDTVLKNDTDVVLLDIVLPDLSGYEVARKIIARHGDRRPMLIGISGKYKKGSEKILSEIVGFDHYLTKPYEPSEVLRLIAPLRYPPTESGE